MTGILSSMYIVSVITPEGALLSRTDSHVKRLAIRKFRKTLRAVGIGYKGDVRTKEGTLIYQAHVDGHGKIVAEEL